MNHEKIKSMNKISELLSQGVQIIDIEKIDIRGNIKCGKNVIIDTNVIFHGEITIGDSVIIGSNSIIRDSIIGNYTEINPYSMVNKSQIMSHCRIGPYARIRKNCVIGENSQIGNFVEIKNSSIGDHCRINHMAFIGDAKLENHVTIGAGTITCNHDGIGVNKTLIRSGAFIGSNVNLIAPVTISSKATIGSGSTITSDAPKEKLTLERSKQITIENWKGPKTRR